VDGIFFGAVAAGLAIGAAYPAWLAILVIARYALPAAVGGALLLWGLRPQIKHTFFGQVCTTLIAVLLGGVALFRGLGLDADAIVRGAAVVLPIATLLTFYDLGRVALRSRERAA
jgi:phosphatidylglycerophosphate synthase